jgi:F0F1-type ATP synthase assembly protein I
MSKYLPRILAGVVVGVLVYVLMATLVGPGLLAAWTALFIGMAVAYILSNLAGNRKVATVAGADRAQALQLRPAAGKALLVVARDGFVAKLAGLNLALDGREFAQIRSPAFTLTEVAPGAHSLSVGFGGLAGPQSKAGAYAFEAAEGAVTAVMIGVSLGALQNSFHFTPEPDLAKLKARLARMPMVAAGT